MPTSGLMPRVTLREVADHAGVHPATVSRALNPETQAMVNSETLARVLASARELKYQTNTIARSLRTQRSLTVGVLIPDIMNPLFPSIVRGIEDTLDKADYTSLIAYTDGRADRVTARLDRLRQRGVDGLIVATAQLRDPTLEALLEEGVAVVQVNRRSTSRLIPSVTADAAGGMLAAIRHLAELGHERIAYAGAPLRVSTGRARIDAFRRGMRAVGLELASERIEQTESVSVGEGARVGRELLERDPQLTAIVTANDLIALGCYDAVREAGRDCPADVSVIGFNDMPFTDRFDPPLTSVHFDQYEMGATAAAMLLRRLAGEESGAPRVELETTLVVRASTAPPPRA
ncbi:MAG: LacI family transcriptional regulator [Solirubrobacterales bacterium]|nr:LacI family transcriptional regulator [Solirubrobacterales bacterium]